MKILFEDAQIIVAIKPIGLLSQSDNVGKSSMVSLLANLCGTDIYPLHRLDRDVGGVMVYAKTKTAAAKLSADIAKNKLNKEYVAKVQGCPACNVGILEDLLFHDSRRNKTFVVKRERKGVKAASLEYRVLETVKEQGDTLTTLHIRLHTGRTHQIRVQFASRGMPLAGDRKYGAHDNFKNIALWSQKIEFNHPLSNAPLSFFCPPDAFI